MSESRAASVGKRYEILGELGRGGMGAVYRVRDRLRGQNVALKRVLLATAKDSSLQAGGLIPALVQPTVADIAGLPTLMSSSEQAGNESVIVIDRGRMSRNRLHALRLALANEFRLLASLRHPNIVSVLDYGFAPDGQPYFTMELLDDSQSLASASQGGSSQVRTGLLLQILQALSYLHRHGVLHRDLKPANVRCVETAAGPRVKLLDFGLALLYGKHSPETQEIAGTVGYLAPEVLQGQAITPQSDLYSYGVLAFELLTGRSPFAGESLTTLVAATLTSEPSFQAGELPEPVARVLSRLLARQPQDRYASAEEAAAALAIAVGVPPLSESAELRSCVIGSAALVGREVDLAELRGALREAQAGRGQLVLLAGESGIGKSRLVEELRTLALVEGAAVLSAQGRTDGTSDLALYTEVLRALCLEAPPPPLGRSILKGVAPDLPQLLGEAIADPPEIDAQAARQRLMSAVEETLLGVKQATVVLIEDLHWAGPDSIAVLQKLSAHLHTTPLLIVGSYRSDERGDLPSELPRARVLQLARLRREDIALLSASILGLGRASDRLLDWLTRESEGNSFFITEVMRAVAEETGSLDSLGTTALPQGILTGGMDAVLRRRLAQAPQWTQPLLRLAAIAGRQLALEALRHCSEELDQALRVCAAAGILEVHQAAWRFSHDKLRERLLADIPAGEQVVLHRQFAVALELAHPDAGEVAARLAYHFERGSELAKAATYAALAGEAAVRRGAMSEAVTLLKQARSLQDRLGLPAADKVITQRQLAESYYGLSQLEAGVAAVREALALLGQPLPPDKSALERAQVRLSAQLLAARVWPPPRPTANTDAARQRLLEEVWLHTLNIEMSGFIGRLDLLLYSALYLASLGVTQAHLAEEFPFSLTMTFLMSMLPLPISTSLSPRLSSILRHLPEIPRSKSQLLTLRIFGAVYHYRGQQRVAVALLRRALTAADQLRDTTTQKMVLSYLIRSAGYLGDYACVQDCTDRLAALAETLDDDLWRHFASLMLCARAIYHGDHAAAWTYADQSSIGAPAQQLHYVSSMRAISRARLDRLPEAVAYLSEALTGFERQPINSLFGNETYAGPIETALYLAERASGGIEAQTLDMLIRRGLRVLDRYAALSQHGWALACLSRGRIAYRHGHRGVAAWYFRAAGRLAKRHEMDVVAARALAWRGRSERNEPMLHEALCLLRRYGANGEADSVSPSPR